MSRNKGNLRRQIFAGTFRWLGAVLLIALLLHLGACGQATASGPNPGNGGDSARTGVPRATVKAERYDLARDEERGGHTLKKHVGRSDEELQERLRRERNISAASTWTDRVTAETTVAAALRAEQGRIQNWMRRGYPRANLALHYDAGHTIGRSLRAGETQTVDCTNAAIVLRADGPDSFYVLTTYPEARQ
jgi:Bacterial CdiA-CT RNAse A domain